MTEFEHGDHSPGLDDFNGVQPKRFGHSHAAFDLNITTIVGPATRWVGFRCRHELQEENGGV